MGRENTRWRGGRRGSNPSSASLHLASSAGLVEGLPLPLWEIRNPWLLPDPRKKNEARTSFRAPSSSSHTLGSDVGPGGPKTSGERSVNWSGRWNKGRILPGNCPHVRLSGSGLPAKERPESSQNRWASQGTGRGDEMAIIIVTSQIPPVHSVFKAHSNPLPY